MSAPMQNNLCKILTIHSYSVLLEITEAAPYLPLKMRRKWVKWVSEMPSVNFGAPQRKIFPASLLK